MVNGTKTLWAEDINTIILTLLDSDPCRTLSDEDQDAIAEQLDRLLDPYCHGYQNYN